MAGTTRVPITLGLDTRPPAMALIDGTVKPEGIDLTCVCDFPEPSTIIRHDEILDGKLDGGELSLSFLAEANTRGARFVGIPVFPNRSFRHRSIYCRDSAGIKTPADLKGKRVGLHIYTATTMVWVRGILRDEFDVQPQDIQWHTLMDRHADRARQSGVSIQAIPSPGRGVNFNEYIAQMIERDELDAGVGPVNIVRPGISRLFPDFAVAEAEYYRRTGIYPIIHTLAINERVVRDNPWVPRSLFEAFRKSAALAPGYIAKGGLKTSDREIWEVDRPVLGGDNPYEWGLGEKERRTIDAFLSYLVMDGVITAKPDVESLFPRI